MPRVHCLGAEKAMPINYYFFCVVDEQGTISVLHSNLKQLKSPRALSMNALNSRNHHIPHHIPLGLGYSPNKSGLATSSPALLNSNHEHKIHDQSVSTQQVSTMISQSNKSDECRDNEDTCKDSMTNSNIPEARLG